MRGSKFQEKLRRGFFKGVVLSSFYLAMAFSTPATDGVELTDQQEADLEEQLHQIQQSGEGSNFHVFSGENFYFDFLSRESAGGPEKASEGPSEVIKESLALSIDGGGIRGLMPAKWLATLEEELLYDHNVPLYRVFDYIGGTSIGGILSLGLAHGIRAADLVRLFEDEEQRQSIFPKAQSRYWIVEGIRNALNNTLNYFSNRYDSGPLESLLKNQFGEHAAIDALRTNVLVTACTIEGVPFLFERKGQSSRSVHGNYHKVWEVARCTSAAPTYFEAYTLEEGRTLVDGGLWINNPSILVAGRMIKQWRTTNIGLLSLGTGVVPSAPIPANVGKFAAIKPVLDVLMNSNSLGNHLAMEQFLGEGNYTRINPRLGAPIDLDATDPGAIGHLQNAAQGEDLRIRQFYARNQETVRHILERGSPHAEEEKATE